MHSLVQAYEHITDENRHILQACNVSLLFLLLLLLFYDVSCILLMQIN